MKLCDKKTKDFFGTKIVLISIMAINAQKIKILVILNIPYLSALFFQFLFDAHVNSENVTYCKAKYYTIYDVKRDLYLYIKYKYIM